MIEETVQTNIELPPEDDELPFRSSQSQDSGSLMIDAEHLPTDLESAKLSTDPQATGELSFQSEGSADSKGKKAANESGTASYGAQSLNIVAAGHASRGGASIKQGRPSTTDGKPAVILKVLDEVEHEIYKKFDQSPLDTIRPHVPRYEGTAKGVDKTDPNKMYIRIGNLLLDFDKPKVLDVKLGVRTYLESECQSKKPRPDLFKRMLEMYPDEPTADEIVAASITKHRWMSVRDKVTTIGNLGYRIDGIAGFPHISRDDLDAELARFRTLEDTVGVFREFTEVASTSGRNSMTESGPNRLSHEIATGILQQLQLMRKAMEGSDLVQRHEFIGSSLLILADAKGTTAVNWIDFAKTNVVPDGLTISHRKPWEVGNHEDGILVGMDSMVEAWSRVVADFSPTCSHSNNGSLGVITQSMQMGSRVLPAGNGFGKKGTPSEGTGNSWASNSTDIAILSQLPGFWNMDEAEDLVTSPHSQLQAEASISGKIKSFIRSSMSFNGSLPTTIPEGDDRSTGESTTAAKSSDPSAQATSSLTPVSSLGSQTSGAPRQGCCCRRRPIGPPAASVMALASPASTPAPDTETESETI